MSLPDQWARVVMADDGSKEIVRLLHDGTTVPLNDPRGLRPYGEGWLKNEDAAASKGPSGEEGKAQTDVRLNRVTHQGPQPRGV